MTLTTPNQQFDVHNSSLQIISWESSFSTALNITLDDQKVNYMSPRSPLQFESIRNKSRENISTVALELFAVYGYQQTSMNQIAQKANISKGLIYNYFPSKANLLESIVTKAIDKAEGMIDQELYINQPKLRLKAFIHSFFDSLQQDITFWQFINSLFLQSQQIKPVKKRLVLRMMQFLESLEELFYAIGVENPAIEARLFAAIFDGIGLHYSLRFEQYPLQELEKNLVQKYCSE